jgi:hypothetical protein
MYAGNRHMKRNLLLLIVAVLFFSLITGQVFSQQEALGEEKSLTEDWVLGDVIELNLEGNKLILSYIDYNTDEDKEIAISVDATTNYENADSLQDIKVGDVVGIDYVIGPQGKAKALNISVERLEQAKQKE